MSRVDLNLLTVLRLLLETQSVTRTAERLQVSQPAISRSLAQLRELFGDPLLIRTNAGMILTQRAEELIEPLRRWVQVTSEIMRPGQFNPAEMDRRFKIASTDYGVLSVIEPTMRHVLAEAPGASLDIVPFSVDMKTKLAMGEIDLIVTGIEPDRSLAYDQYLFSDTSSCLIHRDHPLADKAGPMTIEEYLNWPHISLVIGDNEVDPINNLLGSLAERRKVVARLPYFHAAMQLAEGTDVILTLPTRMAQRLGERFEYRTRPAPPEITGFNYWVIWHVRSQNDKAINWLVDMFAKHAA